MSAREVVVTGGAGFIGSNLVEKLRSEGETVHVVDNLTGPNPGVLPPGEHVYSSIKDAPAIGRAGVLYHLAASVDAHDSIINPLKTISNNIESTQEAIDYWVRNRCRMVYVSTCMVEGSVLTPYAISKRAGEYLCYAANHQHWLRLDIVRPSNVYGPGQVVGLVPEVIRCAKQGKLPAVYGSGNQEREMCYVGDVVCALYSMLLKPAGVVKRIKACPSKIGDIIIKIQYIIDAPEGFTYSTHHHEWAEIHKFKEAIDGEDFVCKTMDVKRIGDTKKWLDSICAE